MQKIFLAFLLSCVVIATPARAQWAPDVNIGTLGAGVGATIALGETTALRLGIAGWSDIKRDVSKSDVDYHAKIKLANAPILLDWHPGGGSFRLSAGVIPNNDQADLEAVPSATSTFNFNGTTYTTSQVGSATGTVKVKNVAPYLGFGFGNPVAPDAGWSFSMDLGAMYLGTPKATLTATCATSLPAATCTQLQNDVSAEEAQLNDAIKNFKWYPVVQLHIGRKF